MLPSFRLGLVPDREKSKLESIELLKFFEVYTGLIYSPSFQALPNLPKKLKGFAKILTWVVSGIGLL